MFQLGQREPVTIYFDRTALMEALSCSSDDVTRLVSLCQQAIQDAVSEEPGAAGMVVEQQGIEVVQATHSPLKFTLPGLGNAYSKQVGFEFWDGVVPRAEAKLVELSAMHYNRSLIVVREEHTTLFRLTIQTVAEVDFA